MKRGILTTLLLLSLIIAVLTGWLLNTESGLRWVYQQLQPRLPVELQLQQLEGVLGDTIVLRGIKYSDDGIEFSASQISLQWNPWALLSARVQIISLDLKDVRILLTSTTDPATSSSAEETLPQLKLPVQVTLQQASVDQIALQQANNSLQLKDLVLQAESNGNEINIDRLDARATDIVIDQQQQADVDASLKGKVKLGNDYRHDLQFEWKTNLPAGSSIENRARLVGNLDATQLTQQSTGPLQADLMLELRQPLEQLQWQASLAVTGLDTALLDTSLPGLRGALELTAHGDLQSAQLSGEFDGDSTDIGKFRSVFKLRSLAAEQLFDGLQIDALQLAWLDGDIDAQGRLLWVPTLRWDSNIVIKHINPAALMSEWPGDLSARLHTEGRVEGEQTIASATISESSGSLRDYPFSLQGNLHWQDNTLRIDSADLRSGASQLRVDGKVGEQLDLQWSLDSADLAQVYPQAGGQLTASGHLGGVRDAPFVEANFKGHSLSFADHKAEQIEGNIAIDLFGWQKMDLQFKGSDLELQGQRLQSVEVTADRKRIDATLLADTLSARLGLVGELRDQSWRGKLQIADLESAEFGAWHLKDAVMLNLSAQTMASETLCLLSNDQAEVCAAVQQRDAEWDIELDLSQLPLQLLQTWTPPELQLDGVLDAVARLSLTAAGDLFGQVDATFPKGNAGYAFTEDASERFEYRQGTLKLTLDTEGISTMATLALDNGDNLEGRLQLPGARILEIDTESQSLQAAAKVNFSNWSIAAAMIPHIENLQGSLTLDLTASGTLGQPRIQGSANLRDAGFRLPEQSLEFEQIELNASSEGSDRIEFDGSGKLANGNITLKGNTILSQQEGWPSKLSVQASDLQIAQLLGRWIEPPLSIEGLMTADAELSYHAPDQLHGELKISAAEGRLNYPLIEQEIESWPFRDGLITITLGDHGIEADSAIDIGSSSSISASMKLAGASLLSMDLEQQALQASAKVNFDELELIELVVPEIDQVKGQLTLDMSAGGTVANPELQVQAQIPDASLQIPRLGLQISQLKMQGTSDDLNRFNFNLSAVSGEGKLTIEGNTELNPAKGWPSNFSIKGDNFEVSKIPEAQVTASPDLLVTREGRSVTISGDLLLPYAKLQPKDISTATKASRDTVIIGAELEPPQRLLVTTRVNLILGERVSFYGFGFEGRLGGNVLIEDLPDKVSIGTGEITIPEGRYRAYGQRLDVNDGRILFTGSALDNPGLDARAVRQVDDITVGLLVRGRLQQPTVELFSNPAMGQSDMLSYLLLGRPVDNSSDEDGEVMAEAALALGLAGGDSLARLVGDNFGLDEVRVEAGNTGDQASLVVGHYLSPELYVSYGVGLLESINTLNLRYTITERWRLEAESGEYQGADLLYTIER